MDLHQGFQLMQLLVTCMITRFKVLKTSFRSDYRYKSVLKSHWISTIKVWSSKLIKNGVISNMLLVIWFIYQLKIYLFHQVCPASLRLSLLDLIKFLNKFHLYHTSWICHLSWANYILYFMFNYWNLLLVTFQFPENLYFQLILILLKLKKFWLNVFHMAMLNTLWCGKGIIYGMLHGNPLPILPIARFYLINLINLQSAPIVKKFEAMDTC